MTAVLVLIGIVALVAALVSSGLRAVGRAHMWPAGLVIVCAPLEVYRTNIGAGNLSAFRLAMLVALVALAIDLVRRPPRRLSLPVPVLLYGGLLVLQIVSLLVVTRAPSLGTRFMLQYLVGIATVAIILRFVRPADVQVAAGVIAASLVFPALASVYRILAPPAAGGSHSLPGLDLLPLDNSIEAARKQGSFLLDGVQRFQGTFADPNHFAFFVGVGTLVLFGLLVAAVRTGDRSVAIALGLALAGALVLLVGSYSRSAWLLTAVAVAFWMALAGKATLAQHVTRRRLAIIVAGLLAAAALAAPAVIGRVDPATAGTAISTEEHGRTMRLALDLATERPLYGVGLGSYGSYAGQPALVSSSHSTLLSTAAELGFPGLLLLLAVIGVTAFAGVRSVRAETVRERRAVITALVAVYAGMAIANIAYEVWADDFQWTLFGVVLALTAQPHVGIFPLRLRRRERGAALASTVISDVGP